MEDYTKIFEKICVNKSIAIGLISVVTISSIKDIELHSMEFFPQDQITLTPSATGAYGVQAIGGQWLG
jgi:hypothetical protein